MFNGAATNLGWTSGNAAATQPQRWAAQPFTLPAGNWRITTITPQYFVPAGLPTDIGFKIWSRVGQIAPAVADEKATGSNPYTAASAPLAVDVTLPGGDYYLSIYAIGPVGNTIGWFTNAPNGIHFIDPINNVPFMWRGTTYPPPSWVMYELPATTLAPYNGSDPNKLYCASFKIDGFELQPYCASGAGGLLNDNVGGTWPTALPAVTFSSSVTLPPEAVSITSVKLHGPTHTYVGDVHFVLVDPSGIQHNLIQRIGFTGSGFGSSGDFVGGDFEIVESGGATLPSAGNLAGGTYNQYFGTGGGLWPNGNAGVFNTPISAIPVVPGGLYTLVEYDWAGGDTGSLASWELCGVGDPAPDSYCTAGTSLNGCTPSMTYSGLPSASNLSGFAITMINADAHRFCGMIYSLAPAYTPISGSSSAFCVASPWQRVVYPLNDSGGVGTCDGTVSTDLLNFVQTYPGALGAPFSSGETLYIQGFNRDSGNGTRNLNMANGLRVTFIP
jgi:hypothetical protein